MPLTAGDKLGHYEVLSLLVRGGVGEVYRARDTKLKREVAIKVLPEALARDPARMVQRFLAAIPVESFSEGLIHLTVNWLAGAKK